MANLLPVSRVVNVLIEMGQRAAATRNFGNMLVLGDSDIIDAGERYRDYSTLNEVAADFGVLAPEYLAAQAFFSQSPQPSGLTIGRWVRYSSSARLRGATLSEDRQALDIFTAITDGILVINVGGQKIETAPINLSDATGLNMVASKVSEALGDRASVTFDGYRFIVATAAVGESASIAVAEPGVVADAMGLSSGVVVAGVSGESAAEAVMRCLDSTDWYGLFVSATLGTEEAVSIAGAIEGANPARIVAFTDQSTNCIDPTSEDCLAYRLKALGYNRSLVMYSSKTPYAAMSVLGRMATVNFEGSNTTITLKFKNCPGVEAERLTTSQANALVDKNCNVFVAYQNDTAILQEGVMAGGWFIDERHGLDWLQNRIQTDLYNLLYTSTTKVGQDDAGMTTIVGTVNRSMDAAVRNGLCAAGVWTGDEFGSLKQGDTLPSGYYVYIVPLAEQSKSDREARKAPPIKVAAKLKGAIHFADVTVVVNR